ncbi:hypothetical protein BJX66DRAFT_336552 [Aspergillus keveii]|uniref:Uncharacterized protein n=1 Tax=Aspergillus keveii TaxID=714993 RepID=A0ABR4G9Z5_9EURO
MSRQPITPEAGGHDPGPSSEYEPLTESNTPMPPKLQRQSKAAGRLAQIVDTWFYECLTMIFSLACFGAVVSLLVVTDGKPPPSFAYGLTLNAIVSLLGTACKSSLIFVIGECIGQLKWIWFYKGSSKTLEKKRKQHLDGMQLFDTASRGPLGSLFILLEHKGQSLVSLGALVIVLALIFDPFMQQLLRYPVREIEFVNSSSAAAPQIVVLLPEHLTADPRSIMYTGIWSEDFEVCPTCPSGNCTWEPFQSVGMCSQCEDVTQYTTLFWIRYEVNTTRPELQGAEFDLMLSEKSSSSKELSVVADIQPTYSTSGDSTFLNLGFPQQIVWTPYYQSSGGRRSNATYMGVRNPLYVLAHAELEFADKNLAGTEPMLGLRETFRLKNVTQCVLSLCSRTYTMSVSNGDYSVETSPPDYGTMFENPHMDPSLPPESTFCWKAGTNPDSTELTTASTSSFENRAEFAFCPTDTYCLYDYFDEELMQYNGSSGFSEWGPSNIPETYGKPDNGAILKTPILDRIATVGLETVVQNIAASFTKAGLTSRTNATAAAASVAAANTATIRGTVRLTEIYVSVRWL